MHLHKPTLAQLPLVISAWQKIISETERNMIFQKQNLTRMQEDGEKYLAALDGKIDGETLTLEDGSIVPRLPSITRYMWADEKPVGSISFRRQPGSNSLPLHVLGHIGYETFPWAQRKGFATSALKQMLDIVRNRTDIELKYVEIVTDPDNKNSQRVIEKNGGKFIEKFRKPATSDPSCQAKVFRFRIQL